MGRARERRRPGICRVCGCTDGEACIISYGRELEAACFWVEPDLCSRCHGPRRPTRRQAGELGRIRAAKGRVQILHGQVPGELRVRLEDQVARDRYGGPLGLPPVLTLDRFGHAIDVDLDPAAQRRREIKITEKDLAW